MRGRQAVERLTFAVVAWPAPHPGASPIFRPVRAGLPAERSLRAAAAGPGHILPSGAAGESSLHSNVLAAKAVCLGEALRPEFGDYGRRIVDNARILSATLAGRGIGIAGGGTDTHMVLLDLASLGLLGRQAETALALAGITSNSNPAPFDPPSPPKWTGLRFGVAAITTQGMTRAFMRVLGGCIADLLLAEGRGGQGNALERVSLRIARLREPPDG